MNPSSQSFLLIMSKSKSLGEPSHLLLNYYLLIQCILTFVMLFINSMAAYIVLCSRCQSRTLNGGATLELRWDTCPKLKKIKIFVEVTCQKGVQNFRLSHVLKCFTPRCVQKTFYTKYVVCRTHVQAASYPSLI